MIVSLIVNLQFSLFQRTGIGPCFEPTILQIGDLEIQRSEILREKVSNFLEKTSKQTKNFWLFFSKDGGIFQWFKTQRLLLIDSKCHPMLDVIKAFLRKETWNQRRKEMVELDTYNFKPFV